MKKIFVLFSALFLSAQWVLADVINPLENWRCIDKTGSRISCPADYQIPKVHQEFPSEYLYVPFPEGLAAACKNGKCGYKDEDGNWVIEPKFYAPMCYWKDDEGRYNYDYHCRLYSSRFSEGLAAVEYEKNKTGYINKKGELVIKYLHGYAGAFSEGLAAAMKEGSYKYGYIDKTGRWVIPPQFKEAGEFKNGAARVSIMLSDKSVCEIKRPKLKEGAPRALIRRESENSGLWEFEDILSGKIMDFKVYGCSGSSPYFSEGLAAAAKDSYGLCGYIDTYGNWVIEPKYDLAYPFKDGKAKVSPCGNPLKTLNKKEAAAVFSAVLLILVIIAAFSMRKLKK